MARRVRAAAIVTAHHSGDQAETVLMNFLRGSGPAGLAGIPPARLCSAAQRTRLFRPFLQVTKDQIQHYLKKHSLPFRQDASNQSARFTRNRIRHDTLPYLEARHPGLSGRLVQAADIFRQEENFWQRRVRRELRKTVRKDGKRFTVVLPQLLRYHKALSRRILRQILPGLSFQEIEQVLALAHSPPRAAWVELSGHWRIRRVKNRLVAMQKRIG
jgi:tRNA(Ile)-lysidine synthase